METFALAAISFIIAVALLIRKKKNPLQIAFASLCLALFAQEAGKFFSDLSPSAFFKGLHYLGAFSVPPLAVAFSRLFMGKGFLPRRVVALAAAGSAATMAVFLFPDTAPYGDRLIFFYTALVLSGCYLALLLFIRSKAVGTERKRMTYAALACGAAAVIGMTDLLAYFGYGGPRLSEMATAGLLYFFLLTINHPDLPELYELMARAFIVLVMILFATAVFFVVDGLFGKGPMPEFAIVVMAALLIVIALDPLRQVLRKAFEYFFPESKDFFTSIYGFDEELEKEKAALLEEMATGLAHEIRNPLGSIKGAAQYLQSEGEGTEGRKLLDVIIEETDRLNRVVSQFLDYAKPFRLDLKKQDINRVIEKAVSLIRANHAAEGIVVETDLNPNLPEVEIDAEQIVQVILNISFNSVEAMPEGGTLLFRTSRIESEKGDAVGIAIRDTGRGMDKEEMQKIFKPFFTTKERGVGLGLAICRRIVKNHGGYIRVKSIPGQGTIFYIRLGVSP